MAHPHWPLFDVEVHTPRLTMRYIDDELGVELADLAARGIHDPGWMPFGVPWSNAEPPALQRQALQFYWRCRAELSPDHWNINFAVIVDDTVVGTTGLIAADFVRMRQFETGSWLGRAFQGQGIGKEMRVATLTLGFLGLGAEWATTGAWQDNGPSLGVTKSLGYTPSGSRRMIRNDEFPDRVVGFEMERAYFLEHLRRDDITLHGVDPAREHLGLD